MSPFLTVALPKGLGQYRGNQSQRQLDVDHPTPGVTQYIPIDLGPPLLEQYPPVIPVRVVSPTHAPFLVHILVQPFLLQPLTAGGAQQLSHR